MYAMRKRERCFKLSGWKEWTNLLFLFVCTDFSIKFYKSYYFPPPTSVWHCQHWCNDNIYTLLHSDTYNWPPAYRTIHTREIKHKCSKYYDIKTWVYEYIVGLNVRARTHFHLCFVHNELYNALSEYEHNVVEPNDRPTDWLTDWLTFWVTEQLAG